MMIRNRELFLKAKEALKNAYAPFSGFTVGAALLTDTGNIYTGVNVENSSIGATICAERTAFVKAISEGEKKFEKIAVVSGEGAVMPCGICRQFMFEFEDDLIIITGNDEDNLKEYTISELLPEGFRLTK
ncbi:MAG TPA: cytidine deaminase [Anaerovoracaceae bacterium]|nr:cytidine deaminase [Anaerovoracaceae bacterium]